MKRQTKWFLVSLGLLLLSVGCASTATREALQSDYDNAMRLFNNLPANAKECAPQEYAKTEAKLAHIQEEISEGHWTYVRKYVPEADQLVRDTKATAKRKCPEVAKAAPPPPPPPPPVEKPTFILKGITFDFDKATIRPTSEPTLKEAGSVLKRFNEVKVRIEGHTDTSGPEQYNQKLSERRAKAVKDYLMKNYGISSDRIDTVGYGETRPRADNSTKEGRKQNRRIEFVVTKQ